MLAFRKFFLFGFLSPALTHPLDGRSSDPPVPAVAGPPGSQIFPCTATIDVSPQPCTTSPLRAYVSTKTLYSEVDCAGCLAVSLRTTSDYLCPTQTETPIEPEDGTTTEWETTCSPTPTLPLIHPRQDTAIPKPSCPTTLVVPVEITGATATVFGEYITVTSDVPCGGCSLVTATMIGGLGAIQPPAVTVTAEVGTSTVYACEN